MIKKFLLIIVLLVLNSPVYSLENHIIISDLYIKSVSVDNKDVISVSILPTINNDRHILILRGLQEGKAVLTINLENRQDTFDVKIKSDETIINLKEGYSFYTLDFPPEPLDIDPPPSQNNFPDILRGRM